ncbi:hypothetical protein CDAR_461271 [Caerostris darwini]|uniref:CCHC-type domain-containing protein n=3 Tax=Caerostris darwini TaxID=1538125 RepID=A0AAV4SAX2_9ARAC|nr:hypothetical protein CDAR_461271 [Caerostris darwini]
MATPIRNATQEKMIDFAENVTTLLTVARTIEGIFAKNKSYHRPTKTAVQQEFLKLDTLFGHKEKIINQLRIEIDSLQQKEKEHNEKIEQLKEKDLQIAMLKGQLEESRNFNREILTDNLKAITEAINTTKQVQPAPTKSFAEAVKKQQTTVILAPKDKDQSVKDMRSNISKQLKKSGELDGVKRVLIDNNQLIIKTKTDEQAQKLQETIEKNTELKEVIMVRTPPEQKAKIICYGIPEGTTEQDLIEGINRVLEIVTQNTKLVKTFTDNNNRTHAIILLLKREAIQLLRRGRIFLDLQSCTVKPFYEIKRCYKCQQTGHTSLQCKNDTKCGKCGESHDTRICKKETKQCINCQNSNKTQKTTFSTDHYAFDNKCHSYRKILNSLRDSTRPAKSNNTQQKHPL